MPVWCAIHLGKNISEFVFQYSWFQIAETFQSLLCDGHSAAVVNRARAGQRLWYRLHFFEINRKVQRVTLSCSCCFTDIVTDVLSCGKIIKLTMKFFNIFGDVYTRDGTILLCLRDASAQIVVSHNISTQVSDPFHSAPPWSPNDMIVTDIYQYAMCPI